MMFNDTIINNLVYANLPKYGSMTKEDNFEKYNLNFDENSIPEDIINVCKGLDIHDKIMSLEKGYFDNLGDSVSFIF